MEKQPVPQFRTEDQHQSSVISRLKMLIGKYYASQSEFAKAVKLDPSIVSKLLDSKMELTDARLMKIVRQTGFSTDFLTKGIGPEYKPVADPLPAPEGHQGKSLERYLQLHGINWTQLTEMLGKKSLAGVTQYKNREQFQTKTRNQIMKALAGLNPTIEEVFGTLPVFYTTPAMPKQSDSNVVLLPFIPYSFRDGIDLFAYIEKPAQTFPVLLTKLPIADMPRRWVVIEVGKDNMNPRLQFGDRVLAYWLDEDHYHVPEDRIVAIQYKGRFRIRRIVENNLTEDSGMSLSAYEPGSLPLHVKQDDIQALLVVESILYAQL